jgi:cytochrome c-type biogenesis protein CcmH/NrfG
VSEVELKPGPRTGRIRHALVPLLVGGLLGFIGGYFAGGGGRPGGSSGSGGEASTAADRVAQLKKEIDRDPQNPKLWTGLGNLYYDREDWDHAVAAYERALRKAPKDPNVLSDLGAAYRNRGEFRRAIGLFEKARSADPDHWQSLLNLVLISAFDTRDGVAARRHFDELKRRYPEIPNLDRIEQQISSLRGTSG